MSKIEAKLRKGTLNNQDLLGGKSGKPNASASAMA